MVSLLSLKLAFGASFVCNELTMRYRLNSDKLIWQASYMRLPVTPDCLIFSEPARSTKLSLADYKHPSTTLFTVIVAIMCERLLTSFMAVLAETRLLRAMFSRLIASPALLIL